MFNGCSDLTLLNLSNFDTSKVTDMAYAFAGCIHITELRLDNCSTDTINDIITNLPTGYVIGLTREIYVKRDYKGLLTEPANWKFKYVD
jgi:surface protein